MKTVNKAQLAEFLHVSLPTIEALIVKGMPIQVKGSTGVPYEFDLYDCMMWRLKGDDDDDVGRLDLNQESARLKRAQSIKTERENAVEAKALGKKELFQRLLHEGLAAPRAEILDLAGRVQRIRPDLPPDVIQVIRDETRTVLNNLTMAKMPTALREFVDPDGDAAEPLPAPRSAAPAAELTPPGSAKKKKAKKKSRKKATKKATKKRSTKRKLNQ